MKSRKKPSYTALLKEVRKLRHAFRSAKLTTDATEIDTVQVSEVTLARMDTARLFGVHEFALRRDWGKSGNSYRIVALTQEDVYVD